MTRSAPENLARGLNWSPVWTAAERGGLDRSTARQHPQAGLWSTTRQGRLGQVAAVSRESDCRPWQLLWIRA
jgi:hypothetical protein